MATAPSKALATEKCWQPDSLPPFPAVAVQALNMMAGTETSLLDLCNLIRSDAAFSSEILRIANSPLVAFSKNITSVLQASMLLGFRRLRSVVITVGLKAYLAEQFAPPLAACWRHSVACAIISERAAKACSFDKESAYTAGIMHDLGRIALAASMPQSYQQVVARGADEPGDLLRAERELCGLDHCQAGRALVTAWGLPEAFLEITSCHHDPRLDVQGGASVLPPSCRLADDLGFSAVQYRNVRCYADLLAGFPEMATNGFPADGKQLAQEIANAIKWIESA